MPIMMRPSNKARQISETVMAHVQEHGASAEDTEVRLKRPRASSGEKKYPANYQPVAQYGGYMRNEVGKRG